MATKLDQDLIPTVKPASYKSGGYTSEQGQATTYNADERKVGADSLVENRLPGLLAKDNPYMTQAKTSGLQAAAERGMLNSTIAIGAAEDARIRAALPIAQQDASTYSTQSLTNQQASNQARQFNAGIKTDVSLNNANARNRSLEFGAAAGNEAGRYNAGNAQEMAMAGYQGQLNDYSAKQNYGFQEKLNTQQNKSQMDLLIAQLTSTEKQQAADIAAKSDLSLQESLQQIALSKEQFGQQRILQYNQLTAEEQRQVKELAARSDLSLQEATQLLAQTDKEFGYQKEMQATDLTAAEERQVAELTARSDLSRQEAIQQLSLSDSQFGHQKEMQKNELDAQEILQKNDITSDEKLANLRNMLDWNVTLLDSGTRLTMANLDADTRKYMTEIGIDSDEALAGMQDLLSRDLSAAELQAKRDLTTETLAQDTYKADLAAEVSRDEMDSKERMAKDEIQSKMDLQNAEDTASMDRIMAEIGLRYDELGQSDRESFSKTLGSIIQQHTDAIATIRNSGLDNTKRGGDGLTDMERAIRDLDIGYETDLRLQASIFKVDLQFDDIGGGFTVKENLTYGGGNNNSPGADGDVTYWDPARGGIDSYLKNDNEFGWIDENGVVNVYEKRSPEGEAAWEKHFNSLMPEGTITPSVMGYGLPYASEQWGNTAFPVDENGNPVFNGAEPLKPKVHPQNTGGGLLTGGGTHYGGSTGSNATQTEWTVKTGGSQANAQYTPENTDNFTVVLPNAKSAGTTFEGGLPTYDSTNGQTIGKVIAVKDQNAPNGIRAATPEDVQQSMTPPTNQAQFNAWMNSPTSKFWRYNNQATVVALGGQTVTKEDFSPIEQAVLFGDQYQGYSPPSQFDINDRSTWGAWQTARGLMDTSGY